jgi:glycosyltransferase involved in cell wall biosynthesis
LLLSVIVPVYNEGSAVRLAHDAIARVFSSQLPDVDFEILFVDDGSKDDSFVHLSALAAQFPYIRVIKLSRNCGSHMAIRAGFEHVHGVCACFVPCDLQDPPDIIPLMLERLVDPAKIVWAVRSSRQDSLASRIFSRVFFSLGRLLVSKNLAPTGASMFLVGPEVLKSIKLYREKNLILDGLFATMDVQHAYVPYTRQARTMGRSKWTLGKKLKLFADFFVGYSYVPIRTMSYCGIMLSVLGFLYACFVLVNRLFFNAPIQGWTSLMMVVLIIGGFQMTMTGIIGEYLWRVLDEVRERPRYVIEAFLNEHPFESPGLDSVKSERAT